MRSSQLALVLAVSSLLGAAAHADPVTVKSGKVVLPLTGLKVDLPKDPRKGAAWNLAGSWSLTDGGKSFDARDVVDLKIGDKLVAGNWIHIGYFNAGDCAAVVQELDVPERWTSAKDLWGLHFQIAGGMFDFQNALGKAPAIAMCASVDGGQSLLLYHFFLEAKPPVGAAAANVIGKDKLLQAVTKAWKAQLTGPAEPTHHPEITRRGDLEAVRTVTLTQSKLEIALPDDGFVWLARTTGDGDFLDRMAPAAPDLSVEIAKVPNATCDQVMASLTADGKGKAEPPPANVPVGWAAYSSLQLDKAVERVICRASGSAALVIGLLGTPSTAPEARDFGPLAPIVGAIGDAADKAP
jgi:hypothetical protein